MAEYVCPACTTRCGPLDFVLVLKEGKPVEALCPHCHEETLWTGDWVINHGAPGTAPAPGFERDDRIPHIDPWPHNIMVVNGNHKGQPAVTGRAIHRSDNAVQGPDEGPQETEHRLTQSLIAKALNAGEHPIARHKVEPDEDEPEKVRVTIPVVKRPEPRPPAARSGA